MKPGALLIVEDSADACEFFRRFLLASVGSDRMPAISIASTLAQAKEMVAANHYDVCLLDLDLPDSPRMETVAELPAITRTFPPIVCTTGFTDNITAIIRRCLATGAHDFITKERIPKEPHVFAEKIFFATLRCVGCKKVGRAMNEPQ